MTVLRSRIDSAIFLSLFFFLFFTTRQCPSYACDTLYWFCYPLMRAHRGRIVGGVLFLAKCVSHVLSTRVSLSSRNIHVFHALVYSLPVFIPVSFFVCEHPQIHSLRRIILLIRYSHFFYTLPIFLIDYRYFNDVNNFRNFNNYSSGIYLDQRLHTVFQLFNEIEVFYRYVKMSFSVYFAKNSVSIPKLFIKLFLFNCFFLIIILVLQ